MMALSTPASTNVMVSNSRSRRFSGLSLVRRLIKGKARGVDKVPHETFLGIRQQRDRKSRPRSWLARENQNRNRRGDQLHARRLNFFFRRNGMGRGVQQARPARDIRPWRQRELDAVFGGVEHDEQWLAAVLGRGKDVGEEP